MALRVFRLGSFHPYVGAGLGIANLDIDVADPSLRDNNRIGLALAAGARFYFARWVGLRFDVRGRGVYLGTRCDGDEGWNDHGRWLASTGDAGRRVLSFGG